VNGATAAIEGLGSVGSALARMMDAAGVRVIGVSNRLAARADERGLDVEAILARREEQGDAGLRCCENGERIGHTDLLELDIDVLVPCAAHWSLNEENAEHLRCSAVVAAANCPIAPAIGEAGLEVRGILVVPDFVANSGGILHANLPVSAATRREVLQTLYPKAVARLFREAENSGQSVTETARAAAVRRAESVRGDVERAQRELYELDQAFARRQSRIARRLHGERQGRDLARRWLDPERVA
jgi:glutamate dehydrogenase/leucine dehydrogenase